MIAAGIDLGGTKTEVHIFDDGWKSIQHRRVATGDTYQALCQNMDELLAWLRLTAGSTLPIGIGAAGIVNPQSGAVLAANLPGDHPTLPADLAAMWGRPVVYLNDSAAFALSEARFGEGRFCDRLMVITLGTGVSGAFVADQVVQSGFTGTGGEIGHIAAPAHLVGKLNLPLVRCGCGQIGCIETLISGAGLQRIAKGITGRDLSPEEVVSGKADQQELSQVWKAWCMLVADLARTVIRTTDPERVLFGGGLAQVPGMADDVTVELQEVQFEGFPIPEIRQVTGSAESTARGAAFAAWQAAQ